MRVSTLTERRYSPKAGSTFRRAFTLVEVLVVLLLISLTFTITFTAFSRVVLSSLSLLRESERVKGELLLFWELERALVGSRELLLKEGRELFLLTSGGSLYRGLIKKAFIYRNGVLYTYEFPYNVGSLDFYEEDKLIEVFRTEKFRILAVDAGGTHRNYEGLPPLLVVELGERRFTFKIR